VSELPVLLLSVLYTLVTLWLTVYGLNSWVLVVLYWRHRRHARPAPPLPRERLPAVTVQLAVYNEQHVVERLLDAVAALDYPRDRLQVQVLDDSTDGTARLVEARAARHRAQGLDIEVLHRAERRGFKAGALAEGLARARGEFIAIFDADFRPHPDFLLRTIPHLVADPSLGMVQARWTYLNADYSLLTRLQALALDGHFVVEQTARSRAGLPLHFNGTAGVWRRACIEAAGGWQWDTLCEDLDLSYRAQVAGWRFLYLPDVEGPSELPPQVLAFKRQQARWAQGAIQCLRKLFRPLVTSRHLSPVQKLMGMLHLSAYLIYPLMLAMVLLALPLQFYPRAAQGPLWLLTPACLGPILVYVTAQREVAADWGRRLLFFPLTALVGMGIAWSNVRGIWAGFRHWGGEMVRTPKFNLEGRRGDWSHSNYRLRHDPAVVGEVTLALYALAAAAVACLRGGWGALPYLLLYALSFGTVAVLSLREMAAPRRRPPIRRKTLETPGEGTAPVPVELMARREESQATQAHSISHTPPCGGLSV